MVYDSSILSWGSPMKLKTSITKKTALTLGAIGVGAYLYKKGNWHGILKPTLLALPLVASVIPAHAQMSQALVMNYANTMQSAANSRNISQIARLISDDAVISLTRQGKGSTTLDKAGYLDLLQKGWTQADNYQYTISVDNIVITGDTARASVITKETWTKDGQTRTLLTTSKATLGVGGNNALLLRAVSQVTLN